MAEFIFGFACGLIVSGVALIGVIFYGIISEDVRQRREIR